MSNHTENQRTATLRQHGVGEDALQAAHTIVAERDAQAVETLRKGELDVQNIRKAVVLEIE